MAKSVIHWVLALVLTVGGVVLLPPGPASAEPGSQSNHWPRFRVDPDWPKPLPNQWLLGQVAGVAVDQHDTIWIGTSF